MVEKSGEPNPNSQIEAHTTKTISWEMLKKKEKTTLQRAESCSMSLCHYQTPHLHYRQSSDQCSCSDVDLCCFKGVICEKRPEFEGSFKTVWGQHDHLLLLTPSIATFGYCCTFIEELRCGCTPDWDWTQPLRPTVWRRCRGHLQELWPGLWNLVWLAATGEARSGRGAESEKKNLNIFKSYLTCVSCYHFKDLNDSFLDNAYWFGD